MNKINQQFIQAIAERKPFKKSQTKIVRTEGLPVCFTSVYIKNRFDNRYDFSNWYRIAFITDDGQLSIRAKREFWCCSGNLFKNRVDALLEFLSLENSLGKIKESYGKLYLNGKELPEKWEKLN